MADEDHPAGAEEVQRQIDPSAHRFDGGDAVVRSAPAKTRKVNRDDSTVLEKGFRDRGPMEIRPAEAVDAQEGPCVVDALPDAVAKDRIGEANRLRRRKALPTGGRSFAAD